MCHCILHVIVRLDSRSFEDQLNNFGQCSRGQPSTMNWMVVYTTKEPQCMSLKCECSLSKHTWKCSLISTSPLQKFKSWSTLVSNNIHYIDRLWFMGQCEKQTSFLSNSWLWYYNVNHQNVGWERMSQTWTQIFGKAWVRNDGQLLF